MAYIWFIYGLYMHNLWIGLVVSIPTPLKNMSSSIGMEFPTEWKNKKGMFQSPPTRECCLMGNTLSRTSSQWQM